MKKKLLPIIAITTAIIMHQSCESCETKKQDEQHTSTTTSFDIKPDPKCANAPASWFTETTTAAPDDYGPFVDSSKTSDCDFHLWSFQKFLSLTRSLSARAPFQNLLQVSNDLDLIKSEVLSLTDVTQAGSKGVLYDKKNQAIHYVIFVNKQMYDFQKKYLDEFKKNIKQNTDTVIHLGDTVNVNTLSKLGLDTLSYPVGCFELKTSWILASSLSASELKKYYVTKANIGSPSGELANVDVALLGMHIVGRVANHPELIWATFEHDNLAPNYDWSTGKDTTTKIVSDKNFLFYNANTPVNGCPMNNKPGSPAKFTNVFNMFTHGLPESFVSNFAPSHRDSVNNANTVALNKSVRKQLQNKKEVWANYFYKGAMWLDDPTPKSNFVPGNDSIGSIYNPYLRGSRAISNITMETYTQVNFSGIYATGSINCFACHATVDFKNDTTRGVNYNLALSHLFINALIHKFHPKAPKTP